MIFTCESEIIEEVQFSIIIFSYWKWILEEHKPSCEGKNKTTKELDKLILILID